MAGTVVYDAGSGGRLNAAGDGNATTGWTSDGATVGAEPDFWYTGSYCISVLVKTSEVGMYCTVTSTAFNSSPAKVAILKVIMTNKDSLDGNGITIRIGSGTTAYYPYTQIYTSSTYPIAGGWQVVPIDPNISGYRGTPTGSPNLGAVTYFAFRGDCAATAKSANFGVDAVDYVSYGSGLTVTGTSCTFSDFVTFDEGTTTNRYGLVRTRDGILYVLGILTIGTSTLTTFSDSARVLVFPDGRFSTGFSGLKFGLSNASSTFSLTNCSFIGRGYSNGFNQTASGSDTRPILTVSGTSCAMTWTGCLFQNFGTITLTSQVTATGCTFSQSGGLTLAGGTLTACTIDRPAVATSTAYITCTNDLANISQCKFTSSGTGHAIDIQTAGTYSFVKNTFSGYATDSGTAGDRAIKNSSNGNVIINIDTGDTPSINNTGSSTTTVNNTVTLTLTGIVSGSEVRIYSYNTTTERAGSESVTTGSFSYGYTDAGSKVDIVVFHKEYLYYRISNFTLPGASSSIPVSQTFDRQYKNP